MPSTIESLPCQPSRSTMPKANLSAVTLESEVSAKPSFAVSGFLESEVTHILPDRDSICSICCCELTSAVRINKCGHCFDLECLTSWLTCRKKPDTCPMCREKLFQKPDPVVEVFRILKSGKYAWEDFDIPEIPRDETPEVKPAHEYPIATILEAPENAMARIDSRMASSAMVLAANIAILMESIQCDPLTKGQLKELRQIVNAMYLFLVSQDGEDMQVKSLPWEIMLGATNVLDDAGQEFDIDAIWPEDLMNLDDDPARRCVQLAFFVSWVLWTNSEHASLAVRTGEKSLV